MKRGLFVVALLCCGASCMAAKSQGSTHQAPGSTSTTYQAPIIPTLSYSFTGRLMNSRHEAFDTNMVATVEAWDANGKLLAQSRTFRREGSARNYALTIQVASAAASGFSVANDTLDIEVTDSENFVWTGVIDNPRVGTPGAVREVDIVLSEDLDGDGVDDELYWQLKAEWESSAYWVRGETFDVNKDYDGDGVTTLNEALSGTDPFDPESRLAIVAFARNVEEVGDSELVFDALMAGHAYELEETDDLAAGSWKKRSFAVDGASSEVDVISEPIAPPYEFRRTIYLKPKDNASSRFYRIRAR